MATQYTPDEIQQIFDNYHEALAQGIPITKEMAEELNDAKKGIKNYTYTLNQSLKSLGQTTKKTIGDIANGAKGVSVFNDNIDSAGNALANFAAGFGPIGIAVGLLVKAFSFLTQVANKQSDKLFNTFQDLSRSGAVGAQGMTDVFQSMKRFGYTIDELDKMTAVLAENSRDLALFGGTVATGGKQLSNLVDGFKDYRVQLQALGVNTDEQVRAAAGYYKQMGRLGRATDATSAGAVAYIKEMETLTRLTGLQRKDLEEQRDQAEQIDAFYAALMEMDPKAQKEAYQIFNHLMSIDPSGKKARAFAASINGMITGGEEQMQSLFATSFQLTDFGLAVKEGRMNFEQYIQAEADATRQNIGLHKELSKYGAGEFMGGLRTNVLMANKGLDPFADQVAQARGQVASLSAGTDAATAAQAKARVSQIDASNSMQSFVNLGVDPATKALSYLADTVETLTSMLPGSKSKGYGRGGTGTMGSSLAATGAGAAAGAAAGSLLGPVGTVAGGVIGGIMGATGYQMHGGVGTGGVTGTAIQQSGLRIKSTEATAGGMADERLLQTAQLIQEKLGDNLIHFSAFNDSYHQGTNSAHARGRAMDFTIRDPNQAAAVAAMVRGLPGIKQVLDEYNNPSSRATAGHIHAEISGATGFRGTLSGPMSGYRPNLLMHGNEELSVRPMGVGSTSPTAQATEGTMTKMVEKLDDLLYVSKNQLSVNEKILKMQH